MVPHRLLIRLVVTVSVALNGSGCLLFERAEIPNIESRWTGYVSPVKVQGVHGTYDAAVLEIVKGPTAPPDWNVPEELGGGRMPLLVSHDPYTALLDPSKLPSGLIEIEGMMVETTAIALRKGGSTDIVSRDPRIYNDAEHLLVVEKRPTRVEHER